MKALWSVLLAATMGVGVAMPSAAQADEKEKVVSINEIPAPARASLIREAKGAPIMRVEIESAKDKTAYEGIFKQGDDVIGVTVDAQGNVLGRHSEKHEHK
jgi:hypothetical protein